jgi:formylglycine-generating enzyme required for sulfatase activity
LCGNGRIDAEESCDSTKLGEASCVTEGFDGGTLNCSVDCTYDTSSCYSCDLPAVEEACTAGWCTVVSGCFTMGSPEEEACRYQNETRHHVELTHSFRIMATEVSQKQFEDLLGYNPAFFDSCGDDCPVENVSWHEAVAYCNLLSTQKGLPLCYTNTGSSAPCTSDQDCPDPTTEVCVKDTCLSYKVAPDYDGTTQSFYACTGIRLPTEAEWEYAYRAGTTSATYAGEVTSCTGTDATAGTIAWYDGSSSGTPHSSGTLQKNAWGLFDMAGNVAEWADDYYQADLGESKVDDPRCTVPSQSRAVRGGGWDSPPRDMRAAKRSGRVATYGFNDTGFRCARTVTP